MANLQLTVPSMACSACADTITQAVQKVDPQASVQADPKTKQVQIETQAASMAVTEAIAAAGYPVESA
ncbi:MAG: heavy-metal-associated domain-containing protein [Cyanobacteria bacterium P01_A01_bin.123]